MTEQDNHAIRQLATRVLRLSMLKHTEIEALLHHHLDAFVQAFTHPSESSTRNYEWFELLGDAVLNKCMVYYISERFPFLQNHEGVKVIARLKINFVSKRVFSDLAYRLGFLPLIRYQETNNDNSGGGGGSGGNLNLKSILEDVFEAFFGATEHVCDRFFGFGMGHVAAIAS